MSATKEFKIGDQVNVTLKGVIVGKQKQTLFLADDDLTINGKDEYRVCLINTVRGFGSTTTAYVDNSHSLSSLTRSDN